MFSDSSNDIVITSDQTQYAELLLIGVSILECHNVNYYEWMMELEYIYVAGFD